MDNNMSQYAWLTSAIADKKAKEAKTKVWANFDKHFPNADKSKFEAQIVFDDKHNATAEIVFKAGNGLTQSVFGSDRKYWSYQMKNALGLIVGGFPMQLTPRIGKSSLPIPAVGFHEAAPSLKKIFNNSLKIYVTLDQYFTIKFREIFQKTKLTFHSGKEAGKWLRGPNMSYWPQQLNFAVWCATTGCGISREIFDKDHSDLGLPPNVYNFHVFHVYFTIRRILYEMGGKPNIRALPNDKVFNPYNNPYNAASYKKICDEFGVSPTSDFRFTRPSNHGLGDVYIYVSNVGPVKTSTIYPGGHNKFSDEGGSGSKGNLINKIEPDDSVYAQADWFCPNTSEGLTKAGLARIEQTIEAFVYCVLGAQVDRRSSILGSGGDAENVQDLFKNHVEDAIKLTDLAKSVQRYQLAVDEAKASLNFAVCPGTWLMPGKMLINTESVVGYNNKLKRAGTGMQLGINNQVNTSTKKAALQLMDGGKSKINPPNSHPSNPIHKAATAESKKEPEPAVKTTATTEPVVKTLATEEATEEPVPTAGSGSESHDVNKIIVAVGAVAVAGLAIWSSR